MTSIHRPITRKFWDAYEHSPERVRKALVEVEDVP